MRFTLFNLYYIFSCFSHLFMVLLLWDKVDPKTVGGFLQSGGTFFSLRKGGDVNGYIRRAFFVFEFPRCNDCACFRCC